MEIANRTSFAVEALPFPLPEGRSVLTVIVRGTFEIRPDGGVAIAKDPAPVAFGDEYYDERKGGSVKFESDIVPFKPRTDIVLVGKAYAPGGNPAPWVDAALRVGPVSKVLRIFGERKWICDGKKLTGTMTPPLPFRAMDLVPGKAFGGMDMKTGGICGENPEGRGYFDQEIVEDPEKAFLPNIEDPKSLIRHWKDHPRPAGFGVVGKGCLPRRGYLGTYDEKWRKERCPEPPVDFRPDFYNFAQADLQVEGYLRGDEEVLLLNLTPEGKTAFRLPGLRPGVTIERTEGWGGHSSKETPEMRLDTLCILPEERRFYTIWRGSTPIANLTALEIRGVEVQVL